MVQAAQDDAGEVDGLCEVAHQRALDAHHVPPAQETHTHTQADNRELRACFVGNVIFKAQKNTHFDFTASVTSKFTSQETSNPYPTHCSHSQTSKKLRRHFIATEGNHFKTKLIH